MTFASWLAATRPKTLVISLAPILLSQVLVLQEICQTSRLGQGLFNISLAALILVCGLCLQIAVNLANDYYDFKSGVDTANRLGPDRVLVNGELSEAAIHKAYLLFLAVGILAGLFLVLHSHAYLSLIGIICVLAVMTYSAGPLPLAYNGLGELAVFVVFGPIAILGGFYVQLGYLTTDLVSPALSMGLLAAAVMLVNNTRDISTDLQANKKTLAAYLGARGSRYLYGLLLFMAVVLGALSLHQPPRFSYILLPAVFLLMWFMLRREGEELNRQLAQTAMLMLLFSITLSMDLLLD